MYIAKRCRHAILPLVVVAFTACSDASTPTMPTSSASVRTVPGATSSKDECDPNAFMACDPSSGAVGTTIPVDNRIYLHAFLVTNCDPAVTIACSPHCDPYDAGCITQVVDGDYYELRQNLFEGNGTRLGYNSQKWHGWAGVVDIPIFDTRMCAGSGRYMSVEIYHIGWFNTLSRMASFYVYAGNRDQTLIEGNGVTWTAHINWHWDAC